MVYDFTVDVPRELVAPAAVIKFPAHGANLGGYGGARPEWRALVLHTPEEPKDDWESTPNWFANPQSQNSTHYYADSDGDLYQMVSEDDAAWAQGTHAGNAHWKGNPVILPPWNEGVNNNLRALSIEIEGYAHNFEWTDAQRRTVLRWIVNRSQEHGIPLDRDHICGHEELATTKRDPGIAYGTFDIDKLVQDAVALADGQGAYQGVLRDIDLGIQALERAKRYIEGE